MIRVFSIPGADKVFQFRRGSYSAKIYSMSFNLVSSLLCVSSDTETVHIFKLSPNDTIDDNASVDNREHHRSSRQRRSSFHQISRSVGSFLPDRLTDMWEPSRHFASLKLPSAGVRSLVALSR